MTKSLTVIAVGLRCHGRGTKADSNSSRFFFSHLVILNAQLDQQFLRNYLLARQATFFCSSLPLDWHAQQYVAPLTSREVAVQDLLRSRGSFDSVQIIFFMQGVLAVADAVQAADMGVDGIIVSNHGGRQLDYAPAAIDMLPDIAKAIKGRGVTLLVDGGIRRGTDIIKVGSYPFIIQPRHFATNSSWTACSFCKGDHQLGHAHLSL